MIRFALAASSLAVLAACATTQADVPPADAPPPPAAEPVDAMSAFDLAMTSVESLIASGNEQAAIDRLTQLMGSTDITDRERAMAQLMRADLRYGDGSDVWGAIEDFDVLIESGLLNPDETSVAIETRNIARGEATSLNFLLEQGNLSRTERFETLFRLGQYDDAVELMLNDGVTPDNAYLIDLYQIGYLCEGDEYGGPVFDAVEPDGTARALQYCDFGK
ncbi:MAG: hypothetical protein AAF216_03495 [Pseudomonadota bacterium]